MGAIFQTRPSLVQQQMVQVQHREPRGPSHHRTVPGPIESVGVVRKGLLDGCGVARAVEIPKDPIFLSIPKSLPDAM